MSKYIEYLDSTMKELKQMEEELLDTDRKDEANFAKIRINICDICKTVYGVAVKKSSGEALKEEYINLMTKISESWRVSLAKAKEHDDVQKVVIEEIKLEMLSQIFVKFEELGVCE